MGFGVGVGLGVGVELGLGLGLGLPSDKVAGLRGYGITGLRGYGLRGYGVGAPRQRVVEALALDLLDLALAPGQGEARAAW